MLFIGKVCLIQIISAIYLYIDLSINLSIDLSSCQPSASPNIYNLITKEVFFLYLSNCFFSYLYSIYPSRYLTINLSIYLGIHNIEAKDTTSFRIPNLAQNSIYHEAYQISESSRFITIQINSIKPVLYKLKISPKSSLSKNLLDMLID